MKVLADTSVLVPAMVTTHPWHSRAYPWLNRALGGEFDFLVASHTLAELYAVLTTRPGGTRLSPINALRAIQENIIASATVVSLTSTDYVSVIKSMVEFSITGGAIYDALIVRAAQKARVDKLLTFNISDFQRIWPDGKDIIHEP